MAETDYKRLKHDLPLARIKKIMKSDDEVRMISAEVPILFSKACELFILDLTMRAWAHTADTNRRTLQRSDVADAIMEGEGMDFLVDIVPREEEVQVAGAKKGGEQAEEKEKAEQPQGMTTEKLFKALEMEMREDGGDAVTQQANGGKGSAHAAAAAGSGEGTQSNDVERKEV